MTNKQIIYICITVGSSLGSFLPALWGSSIFSVSSVLFGMLGGIVGLWIGYKINY